MSMHRHVNPVLRKEILAKHCVLLKPLWGGSLIVGSNPTPSAQRLAEVPLGQQIRAAEHRDCADGGRYS